MPNLHDFKNQNDLFKLIEKATRCDKQELLDSYLKSISDHIDRSKYEDLVQRSAEGHCILEYILSIPLNYRDHGKNIRIILFNYVNTKLRAYLPIKHYVQLFENPPSDNEYRILHKAINCDAAITLPLLEILKQPGLENILEKNLNERDRNGNMPLQHAVIQGDYHSAQALMTLLQEFQYFKSLEANLSNINNRGSTILMNALIKFSVENVKLILTVLEDPKLTEALRINLNNINEDGFTILQSALYTENADIVNHLLRLLRQSEFEQTLYLNLNNITNSGFTVLGQACSLSLTDCFKTILAILERSEFEKIFIKILNAETKDKFMVLSCAVFSKNEEIVFALLDCLKKPSFKTILLKNINNITSAGFTVLQMAAQSGSFSLVKTILKLIQEELSESALSTMLSNITKDGFTLLLNVLCCDDIKIFNSIIEILEKPGFAEALKENLNAVTKDGFMPLQSSIRSGDFRKVNEIIRLLKKPGFERVLEANIKNISKDNFCILQQALTSKNPKIVSIVLALLNEVGFENVLEENLNGLTKDGFMVLPDALRSAHVGILDELAAVLKQPRFIKSLLLNLRFTNKFGYNCLHQAINTGNILIVNRLDELLDLAYGKNSLVEKRKLAQNRDKFFPSSLKNSYIFEYLNKLSVPNSPVEGDKKKDEASNIQCTNDEEPEEGEIQPQKPVIAPILRDEQKVERSKILNEKIAPPNGGIDDKYLGDTLPQLPESENEATNESNNINYSQIYRLTPLKSFFNQEKQPLPQILKIDMPEFKGLLLTHRKFPTSQERVTFIIAGRKEEALIPLPKKERCVLVLCEKEYIVLKDKLIPYFDVLLIHTIQSESHGVYTRLELPSCRRLAVFLAAHYFNLDTFLMIDDNIQVVKFESSEIKWNGFFNLLRSQMGKFLCVSVKTESNKVAKQGKLGSKIFMINMQELKKHISKRKDLFILFPFAKNQDYWGEDYYMQVALYTLMQKVSQGYHVLDEKIACLIRSNKNKNAFAAIGKRAKLFDLPSQNDMQGLSDKFKACVENTLMTMNNLIQDNINRYNINKALIEDANLLKNHALANGIHPTEAKTELIFNEGKNFFERLKNAIKKISFISSVFREYQIKAIKNITDLNSLCAKLILATGSGKTYLQCELLRIAYHCMAQGEHLALVTPHIDLVNQFYRDFIEFNEKTTTDNLNLAVPPEAVLKVCSHRESCSVKTLLMNKEIANQRSIMIFCVDSLDKYLNESDHFIHNVPMFLLDEFHYYPSTVQNLISKSVRSLILGSSATPPPDTLLAETVFTYTRNQGVREGFLAPVIADSLGIDFSETNVLDLIQCLPLILKQYHPGFAKTDQLKDSKGVIYLPSIEECNTALEILKDKKIKAYSIHSQNPAHKKELQCFLESDEPGVLLAVKMLRIGFNAKDLAWAIIAQNPKDDYAGRSDVEQEIGRVMRKMGDKIGYVLCFDNIYKNIVAPMLAKQPVTLPVNPDYLSQDNLYYVGENKIWQVLDFDMDEKPPLEPKFRIRSRKIIDFQIQPQSFEENDAFQSNDILSYLNYDRISECIFSNYVEYQRYKKQLIDVTASTTTDLATWYREALKCK